VRLLLEEAHCRHNKSPSIGSDLRERTCEEEHQAHRVVTGGSHRPHGDRPDHDGQRRGGTADGQLAEGILVFDSPGGHPHLLGTLTPQLKGNPMLHIPFIAVNHIESTGHVAVTEFFYHSANPTCCPSGRATTVWKWTGRSFIPGRTHITSK
jgi:hypothetical protein